MQQCWVSTHHQQKNKQKQRHTRVTETDDNGGPQSSSRAHHPSTPSHSTSPSVVSYETLGDRVIPRWLRQRSLHLSPCRTRSFARWTRVVTNTRTYTTPHRGTRGLRIAQVRWSPTLPRSRPSCGTLVSEGRRAGGGLRGHPMADARKTSGASRFSLVTRSHDGSTMFAAWGGKGRGGRGDHGESWRSQRGAVWRTSAAFASRAALDHAR